MCNSLVHLARQWHSNFNKLVWKTKAEWPDISLFARCVITTSIIPLKYDVSTTNPFLFQSRHQVNELLFQERKQKPNLACFPEVCQALMNVSRHWHFYSNVGLHAWQFYCTTVSKCTACNQCKCLLYVTSGSSLQGQKARNPRWKPEHVWQCRKTVCRVQGLWTWWVWLADLFHLVRIQYFCARHDE